MVVMNRVTKPHVINKCIKPASRSRRRTVRFERICQTEFTQLVRLLSQGSVAGFPPRTCSRPSTLLKQSEGTVPRRPEPVSLRLGGLNLLSHRSCRA